MELRFLGKETTGGQSPTLYATDRGRRHAESIAFPTEDCWLFDDDRLVLSLFKPEGGSGGFARERDPDLIGQYRAVCNEVWSRAVPYIKYVSR